MDVPSKSSVLGRGLEVLGAVALVTMTLHIVANAVARSLDRPLEGTLETVSYWYMPAAVFSGMVLAAWSGSHTEARVIFDRLGPRSQAVIGRAGQFLAALTSAAIAWFGLSEALEAQRLGLTGGVTGLVIWPTTFAVPLCFAAMAVLFGLRGVRGVHVDR